MSVVYVNIGSNMGSREALIAEALEHISKEFGIYCKSGIVESDPWGFDSSSRFLNIGVAFKSDKEPEEILTLLQQIEKEISAVTHRDAEGHYKDREIDIDIMAIDDIIYESERLTLPHKHLLEREFFLEPLKELAPNWQYPRRGI